MQNACTQKSTNIWHTKKCQVFFFGGFVICADPQNHEKALSSNKMSDVGGLPDLGALVDSDGGGERPYLIIDTGANPDEVMKRRGYSIPIVPGKKEEPPSSSLKRERSPPPAAPKEKATHNFKCTLEHAQHLLDLVDKRADASDKVEELAQKKEDAEDKRLDIEREMFEAARALAPAIVASEYAATCSDADKAVYQAVTNVYRTDPDCQVEDSDDEEDSDEEEYRKSKITIVFWGNETTHNAGSSPQQPGKKTLYVHIIKGQFVRACFSQGEVVYAWINTGLGTGIWEQPVLEKHAPILGEIARLHDRLIWFATQVLRFMKMNERAWRGKSDKTRIFWRDHIIPKLQAVERAHDAGTGHVGDDEDDEEDEDEEPPKRSKSGRKPKKKADPGPTEMSQARQPPKKTSTRGGGRRKK